MSVIDEDQDLAALRRGRGGWHLQVAGRLLGHARARAATARRAPRAPSSAAVRRLSSTSSCIRRPTKSSTLRRPGQHRPLERAAEHRRIVARLVGEQIAAPATATFSAGATTAQDREGLLGRARRPAARALRVSASAVALSATTATTGWVAVRSCASVAMAEEDREAEQQQRREQEEDEDAREDRGDEIAPRDHPGGFEQAHHAASPDRRLLASISRAAASPAMATKASCRPRPLDRQLLDPRAAVDQRLEQRLDAALGQLEMPDSRRAARASAGSARAPCAVGRCGSSAAPAAAAGRAPRRPGPRSGSGRRR